MNITKLPSGNYQIREMHNGKRYSVTVPYKPSKKEAQELIRKKIDDTPIDSMSFEKAAQKFIDAKSNVLSPSTIREYTRTLCNLPDDFKKKDISKIDDYELQKLVNEHSLTHSPKTTANVYGFIRAVIRLFNPKTTISATLPQKRRTEAYTPTVEDVKRILEEVKDTDYYVPIFLATMSLRCSEICALTIDDLNGDNITIDKAYVRSNDGWTLKPCPKTDASNRTITLPHDLAERIKEQGYIFNYLPNQIDKKLYRVQKKLGIPKFGVHRLRHFFASYAHELKIFSNAQIQEIGGWSTSDIFERVYRHSMNTDEAKTEIANKFSF
jgi:integrase